MVQSKPTAKLTSADVQFMLVNAQLPKDQRLTQKSLAERFGVSMKTISRVLTGQTWRDETQINKPKEPHKKPQSIKVKAENNNTEIVCSLLDELVAVKNTFAFIFDKPIHWGWFDWEDGLHCVASDGFILWESADLVDFAQKIHAAQLNCHPFYSSNAKEIGTFDLTELMTKPIGEKFTIDALCGGIVRLIGEKTKTNIFLRQRYIEQAQKHKLEIRAAGKNSGFVYFTKSKTRFSSDVQSYVIACVSTMTDKEE